MNAIVVYKSNTGFTKKYAEWIAEELFCKAVSMENFKKTNLESYDTLVFGGWLFVGNMRGLKQIKSQILHFDGKKAIFATGATPPESPQVKQALENCLTDHERKNIGVFYMCGGLKYDKMGFVHKSMMKMMCSMLKKQHGINSEEYKTICQSFDATDKSLIKPLIEYINT